MNKKINPRMLILLFFIFAIGIAIIWWVANSTVKQMRTELLLQARIAAQAINVKYIASLSGSEEDLKKPAYRRIKGQLASMRAAIEKCRFLYLMGRRSDGNVFFFADSLPPDSKDYAPPGLIYDEVSDSYIHTFENNVEAVVGPVTDRWGTLITALVPIKDPQKGNLIAVLGMDVDANYWKKEILSRCFFPFTIMLLFMFLILLLFSREKVAKSLRQSENKLRATLDATPFPVAVVDLKDDRIYYWSRSAFNLFGHTAPTAPQWYEIAYPDPDYRQEVIEKWKPFINNAEKNGQPINTGEYRVTCKDGSERICELYATFLQDNLIVTFNDITERKRAEEDLSQIFTMSLDMISIADINTATFIKVNPAFTEILGYSEETLLKKSFLDFVHPDDLDATRTVIEQKLQTGAKVINFENRYRCKDGSYRWLSWVAQPSPDLGVTYSVARDITEWKQKEEALKKNKALLDATGRMARVGGWELDANTMKVTWTNETYRIHEAPLGQKPSLQEAINFFNPEDRPKLEEAIQRALDYGEPYDMELRFTTANGKSLWTRTKCEPEVLDGKIIKLKGTFQDITERKQAEEALQASERELKQILDATTDGIWTWNFKSNKLTFSPKYYTMLGYEPDEFPASYETWVDLIHPDDRRKALAVAEEYLKTKADLYENEFRLRTSMGDYRWILATARVAERGKNGEPVYIIGNHQDITERKKAAEALIKREEQYRMLVENANDAIFIAQDGVIKFPNPKTTEITGYSADELFRMKFSEIIHPEDRALVLERHLQRLKGENPLSRYSFRITNKGGKELWVQLNAALINWENRPATINIIRDITQQKQLEDKLRQSQKMESIGTLSGGIAHDFNNILSIILGNTELALTDIPESSPSRKRLREVRKACDRAKEVIQQILSFSRRAESELRPLNIAPIIKESLKLLRATIPTSIDIRHHVSAEMKTIQGDPTQIHQVLLNLCTNAAHAMEENGGILDIELATSTLSEKLASSFPDLGPGQYVKLTVKDTGHGIAPDVLDRIFDPYFTTKGAGKGTGMGLAVVHGIVKGHGGVISVESTPGKGTTFEILFPVVEEEVAAEEPQKSEMLPRGHERILFVDDEAALVRLNEQRLTHLGYQVETRTDPLEALELFRSQPDAFDLIITDTTMPHMTGDRLAQELMKIRPDIPILLCTGYSDRVDKDKAKEMGIAGFTMKPIDIGGLANKVRELLDNREEK